jgi:hypothetical protein
MTQLAITWKRPLKTVGLWDSVREIARMYDAGMGAAIFVPIVFFSWFPFVSTFQSRILFNQAFSRGLEISLILAGNKANQQTWHCRSFCCTFLELVRVSWEKQMRISLGNSICTYLPLLELRKGDGTLTSWMFTILTTIALVFSTPFCFYWPARLACWRFIFVVGNDNKAMVLFSISKLLLFLLLVECPVRYCRFFRELRKINIIKQCIKTKENN